MLLISALAKPIRIAWDAVLPTVLVTSCISALWGGFYFVAGFEGLPAFWLGICVFFVLAGATKVVLVIHTFFAALPKPEDEPPSAQRPAASTRLKLASKRTAAALPHDPAHATNVLQFPKRPR